MTGPTVRHRQVNTNGIQLHVADAGPADGPLVVLCHGFPELWYSWRHQIAPLAAAGYRVIAPDMRGYGESDKPTTVSEYGIAHLHADLLGLLDDIGRSQATFVGHDWGALVVWDLAQLHPERVNALCALSVPLFKTPAPPTEVFDALSEGKFFYMLYFQEVGPAESELERDPRETMRRLLGGVFDGSKSLFSSRPRAGTRFLDTVAVDPPMPSWLTEADLDYFGDAFAKSGFFGPLSYYRNLDANWALTHEIPVSTLSMPVGFISGSDDPVINTMPVEAMQALPQFRGATLIPKTGHWVQQESPQATNAALLAFLATGHGE